MHSVVRSFLSLLIMTVMFSIVIPLPLSAQNKSIKTDALTKEAEVIVAGKVGEVVSQWNKNHTRIETRVAVSVDQTIKGSLPGSSITIVIPGGEVDGIGEWYSHSAKFQKNEDVVLFAKKESNGQYQVASGENGKFSVTKDPRTGAKTISNVGTLEEFTTKIKNIAKTQENNSKQK
jgi:preprotein translocase subunit YajC